MPDLDDLEGFRPGDATLPSAAATPPHDAPNLVEMVDRASSPVSHLATDEPLPLPLTTREFDPVFYWAFFSDDAPAEVNSFVEAMAQRFPRCPEWLSRKVFDVSRKARSGEWDAPPDPPPPAVQIDSGTEEGGASAGPLESPDCPSDADVKPSSDEYSGNQ